MRSVYVETSIFSYLTAWRSPLPKMAGQQDQTCEWWDEERQRFELFVAEPVIREASGGDPDAAQRRLDVIEDLPQLEVTDEAHALAAELLEGVPLPPKARVDALHIAIACVNGIDFLLTWNCRHIANAELRPAIERVCREFGFVSPNICTPPQLSENVSDEE